MLTYVTNDGKTYEEKMAEAISNIPLYTREWTNFNPSDPGMTILETLLGFETLQQDSMSDIPARVKQNLLKLVGFQIRKLVVVIRKNRNCRRQNSRQQKYYEKAAFFHGHTRINRVIISIREINGIVNLLI